MASFQPASHLFERNISLNDLDSALDMREIVRKDVVVPEDVTKHRYFDSSPKYSFVLPSFQDFPIEFRKFVYSFLVDGHILRELEDARRLNWCPSLGRMVTVNTLGDGNCLMHAASIGMWAVNDRYQTLRKTAYEALLEDVEGFYHGRWKAEEEQQILNQIGGYDRTEEQWNHDWEEVIRLISQTEFPCGPNGAQFGSLAEIHIFVLANILRRSIIVVSDDTLRGPYGDSYSPVNFGGVYLPLLWDSVDCVKSPLVIGYANGHFTAVISIEDGKMDLGLENNPAPSNSSNCIHAVPLVKYDGTPLPVHFLYDYEAPLASDRVRQYLDCAKVPFSSDQGETRQTVLVAKLHFSEQPRCMKELIDGYFRKAREEHQRVSRHGPPHALLQPGTKQPALQIVRCQTQGCSFFGSTETGNRCSKCLNEFLRTLGPACEPSQHIPTGQPIPFPQPATVTAQVPNTSVWQHTMSTQTAPNTVASSMTLPVARSVQCHTTGCKYGAMPNGGGLCERCSEAERSAKEMAASMNHMSLASAKHCSNSINGCKFFGLPEHHNLCSRCYRSFCLNMENTLGVLSPTELQPRIPTGSTSPDQCQIQGCLSPGVPALYGMCVECYSRCIHSFIHSQGSSVGGTTQTRPNQPSPPVEAMRKNLLPTGGRNKGVLCASPGCCNEGIFHLADLCVECHSKNSTPSSQMRSASVSTAGIPSFPVPPPPPVTTSASAVPSHQLTSALTGAIGYNYCSNPSCYNPRRKNGRGLCQSCESLSTGSSHANPTVSLQQPTRPFGAATTASSLPPRQNAPAYSSARSQRYTAPEMALSHQVSSPQAPPSGANTGKCAMGCGKPAVQEGGLCEQCHAAAYQLELNRQTISHPSRQQRPEASGSVTRNQVEQRNIANTSSGRNHPQTEATVGKKKAALVPCPSKGCMQFGSPEQNGLCDNCYHKKGYNQQQGASVASGANEQQGSNHMGDLHNTHTTVENHQLRNTSYGLQGPVQVSQIPSPSYESGMSSQYSGLGNDACHGQKCRGTNCNLFGTPQTNGYCSRCFLESTIPLSYPHSIPDFPSEVSSSSVASHATSLEKCRIFGCGNVAATDRHGHCEICFRRFYPEMIHIETVVERQTSELAETAN